MGAGSWGTALGKVLADAGHDVRLWARRSELADEINATHRNSVYLSDVDLPASIVATGVAEEALQGAELVLLAVPSQSLRANLTPWADLIEPNSSVVSLAKGIEVGTLMRMSQVVTQVLGTDPSRVAVLTGPNLASEIAAGQPAATVIGCTDSTRAVALQRAFSTRYFRPYTNSDVVGCEVGGACKNVIALSCGMAAGVGLGEHDSHDHHQGPGRDHAAGTGARCQPHHPGGAGRRRGSGGHLHLGAFAEPDFRYAAG